MVGNCWGTDWRVPNGCEEWEYSHTPTVGITDFQASDCSEGSRGSQHVGIIVLVSTDFLIKILENPLNEIGN